MMDGLDISLKENMRDYMIHGLPSQNMPRFKIDYFFYLYSTLQEILKDSNISM